MSEPRTVLVTGASRGIGRAICSRLLQEGCRVVAVGRSIEPPTDPAQLLVPVRLDLSRLDQLPRALSDLCRQHPQLDSVICNAGRGEFGALEQFSADRIRALIDLNLTSQVLVARAFLPLLKTRRRGDLVFMGSEAALAGGKNGAVYCATKFALRGLAQALREECSGSGVRVAIVNPGMVQTAFFDELSFRPADDPDCHLRPPDVAAAVWSILSARPGAAIDEINLSPQKKLICFDPRP